MEFQNKEITCNCGNIFLWTRGEQEFMQGLQESGKLDEQDSEGNLIAGEVKEPRRCPDCRKKKKEGR